MSPYLLVKISKEEQKTSYFDTAAGQNTMENISYQLTRIANSLETLAAAWDKTPENETAAKETYRQIAEEMGY